MERVPADVRPIPRLVRVGALRGWYGRKQNQQLATRLIAYVFLLLGAALIVVPFAWMISTSLKTPDQLFVYPPQWIPDPVAWSNYFESWQVLPFGRFILNTVFLTALGIFAELLTESLVAYGFARYRFPGRDAIFIVLLATMMLPGVVTLVPSFLIWRFFGLIDQFDPLVLAAWTAWGPAYIFLMRQFFLTIPLELEEAARIDGASTVRIWWTIMTPLVKPVLLAVAVLTFRSYWIDNLQGPIIYINSQEKFPVVLALQFFQETLSKEAPRWDYMMAISVLMALPVLFIFFLAQRYFIEGITLSGTKG